MQYYKSISAILPIRLVLESLCKIQIWNFSERPVGRVRQWLFSGGSHEMSHCSWEWCEIQNVKKKKNLIGEVQRRISPRIMFPGQGWDNDPSLYKGWGNACWGAKEWDVMCVCRWLGRMVNLKNHLFAFYGCMCGISWVWQTLIVLMRNTDVEAVTYIVVVLFASI